MVPTVSLTIATTSSSNSFEKKRDTALGKGQPGLALILLVHCYIATRMGAVRGQGQSYNYVPSSDMFMDDCLNPSGQQGN